MIWTLLLVAALLWPSHGLGLLDGVPLDRWFEAVAVGAIVPALWWLHPTFTRSRLARFATLLLLALKIADAALLTQQGWCVRLETPPLYESGSRVQTSWDARVGLRSIQPRCSAIMSRQYTSFTRFPVWFLNLQDTRPPRVPVRMIVDGYVRTPNAGELVIGVDDGTAMSTLTARLPKGTSPVHFDTTFTGSQQWKFTPQWSADGGVGRDVFATIATTTAAPTRSDVLLGSIVPFAATGLAVAVIAAWIGAAMLRLHPTLPIIAWMLLVSIACAVAGASDFDRYGRLAVLLLFAAPLIPVPDHLKNISGAFLLIGVPWVALLIAGCLSHVGRITMYSVGDDWTTFQRFAHRIYIQGYWLEGGERGFWQQPLYRWIAGALHVVFGDSSIGETFLDAAALLSGALFAVEATRRLFDFRVALTAGILTMVTIALGPNWYVIGRGLSDAVAAGLLYAAALVVLDMRDRPIGAAIAAGTIATIAFYTRLNYLVLILALLVLTLPLTTDTRSLARVKRLWDMVPKRHAFAYVGCIALGILALMLRTWHYLGEFSLFAGTTRVHNATGLGLTMTSFASADAWRRALESVAMIITVQDPPGLNVRAALVIGGVACALLAVAQMPVLRRLPASLVLFCLAALSGGFVARGVAYPGRFSLQLIPVATAVVVASVALVLRDLSGAHEVAQ